MTSSSDSSCRAPKELDNARLSRPRPVKTTTTTAQAESSSLWSELQTNRHTTRTNTRHRAIHPPPQGNLAGGIVAQTSPNAAEGLPPHLGTFATLPSRKASQPGTLATLLSLKLQHPWSASSFQLASSQQSISMTVCPCREAPRHIQHRCREKSEGKVLSECRMREQRAPTQKSPHHRQLPDGEAPAAPVALLQCPG